MQWELDPCVQGLARTIGSNEEFGLLAQQHSLDCNGHCLAQVAVTHSKPYTIFA